MAHPSSGYANRSAEDALLVAAIIAVLLGGFAWVAWFLLHRQIAAGVIGLQHWQMGWIGHVTDSYASLDAQVLATDLAGVTLGQLWRLLHNVGAFFRWPAAALVSVLALACLLYNAPGQFTRHLDLQGLMREQARTFRASSAYVERDLTLVKPADGEPRPADPALRAGEWVARFATRNGRYDEDGAVLELTRQLGAEWHGVAGAAPHVRCMFAAFALHAGRKRDEALQLLGDLATSLPNGRGDGPAGPAQPLAFPPDVVARADAVLTDATLVAPCAAVAARHGFTAPAMMSVLTLARSQAGVLAPAAFNVLKLVDRRLWYALHSLGFPGGQNPSEQPNPRVEAVGSRDHWAAERDAGRPLPVPSLARALVVVRKAVDHAAGAAPEPESPA